MSASIISSRNKNLMQDEEEEGEIEFVHNSRNRTTNSQQFIDKKFYNLFGCLKNIEDFQKTSLEQGELLQDDSDDEDLNGRKICKLFNSNLCFRPKCPYLHMNRDGSFIKEARDTFDLSKSQSEIIANIFGVDATLIEEKIVDKWQLCVKREIRKQNWQENLPSVDISSNLEIDEYYGAAMIEENDLDSIAHKQKKTEEFLKIDYFNKLLLCFTSESKSSNIGEKLPKTKESYDSRGWRSHRDIFDTSQNSSRYFSNSSNFIDPPESRSRDDWDNNGEVGWKRQQHYSDCHHPHSIGNRRQSISSSNRKQEMRMSNEFQNNFTRKSHHFNSSSKFNNSAYSGGRNASRFNESHNLNSSWNRKTSRMENVNDRRDEILNRDSIRSNYDQSLRQDEIGSRIEDDASSSAYTVEMSDEEELKGQVDRRKMPGGISNREKRSRADNDEFIEKQKSLSRREMLMNHLKAAEEAIAGGDRNE